jgi:uncharacterized protein (TIGR03067 family)
VLEVVGRGGMGVVLRAFDEKLHRVVALKVMAREIAGSAPARKRFSREAKAAAAVVHDHIVPIHAIEEAGPVPYLVMQFIEGQSLQQKIDEEGSLELKEILRIGMQIASGLAAAHKQGLVHRDIKPANILLENGVQRVKITDFGLARAVDDASVSQSGVVAGTPQYMSPEQADGQPVDHHSDLFSLGSVMYAMCTGRAPFRASSTVATLKRVCEDTPRPIRELNPDMPEWLCDIISRLHAKKPAERFQSAKEVADLLEQHLAYVQQPGQVAMPVQVNQPVPAGPAPLPRKRSRAVPILLIVAPLTLVPCIWSNFFYFVVPLSVSRILAIPLVVLSGASLLAGIQLLRRGGVSEPAGPTPLVEASPSLDRLAVHRPVAKSRRPWFMVGGVVLFVLLFLCVIAPVGSMLLYWLLSSSPSVAPNLAADIHGNDNLIVLLDDARVRVEILPESGGSEGVLSDDRRIGFNLAPGRYQVLATKAGTLVFQKWVTIIPGERRTLEVDSSWVQLFNGKDLTGWKTHPDQPGDWRVEGGVLVGRGGPSHLFTQRGDYDDFHLRVEAQLNPQGDSGVWFRTGFDLPAVSLRTGLRYPAGYETQIIGHPAGDEDGRHTGSLIPRVPARRALMTPGEWFTLEIIARGNRLTTKVNDKTAVEFEDEPGMHRAGHIALQSGGSKRFTNVQFRKIEIKELPADMAARHHAVLDGRWVLATAEHQGRQVPPEEAKDSFPSELLFKGDRYGIVWAGKQYEGGLRVDPSKNPAEIDFTGSVFAGLKPRKAIYELDGDRLKLCLPFVGPNADPPRPTTFRTEPESKTVVLVYRREDPDTRESKPPANQKE